MAHEFMLDKIAKARVPLNMMIRYLPSDINYFASSIMRLFSINKKQFVKP